HVVTVFPGADFPEPIHLVGAGHEPFAVGTEGNRGTIGVGKQVSNLLPRSGIPEFDAPSMPRPSRDPLAIRTDRNAGHIGMSAELDRFGLPVQTDDIGMVTGNRGGVSMDRGEDLSTAIHASLSRVF